MGLNSLLMPRVYLARVDADPKEKSPAVAITQSPVLIDSMSMSVCFQILAKGGVAADLRS
jgi:hypothetical protein